MNLALEHAIDFSNQATAKLEKIVRKINVVHIEGEDNFVPMPEMNDNKIKLYWKPF